VIFGSASAVSSSAGDTECDGGTCPPCRATSLIVASDSTVENAPANLYVMGPDGSVLRYLTQGVGWNRNAGWAPDGTRIVWTVRNGTGGIWIMNSNGQNQRELTSPGPGLPSYAFGPAVSPDGRQIVYSDYDGGDPASAPLVGIEVFVMNTDGSGKRRLTTTTVAGATNTHEVIRWSNRPAWSPDGGKIVYSSTQSGHSEIWVMNADGRQQEQLTFNAMSNGRQGPDANFPSFSPDGRKIVFLCGWETLYGNICVMNADGSGRTQLTHNADDGVNPDEPSSDEPAWSPDGRSILFDSNQYDPHLGQRAAQTWIMNADGSGQRVFIPHIYGEGRNPWIEAPLAGAAGFRCPGAGRRR
jgi:Tol biopolymer transport system component